MEQSLQLKGFLKSIKVNIVKDGLFVTEKNFSDYHEYHIDFDQLDTKKMVKNEMNSGVLFLIFSTILITIIKLNIFLVDSDGGVGTLIFLILSTFLVLLGYRTRKRVVIILKLYSTTGLELPYNRKNEAEVRQFADLIISKSKEYLITKYGKVDKDLPRDSQFEKIINLKDRDIISEQEFERLKNILVDKEKEKKIGF